MKQFLLFTAMILIALTSNSQNKVLLYGGPQITSAFFSVNGKEQHVTAKPGFHIGTGLKVPFENHLYFAPTLFYSLKGYKVTLTEPATPPEPTATSNETRIHTLEIAPMLQYDLTMKASHLYFKVGPSIDVQLAGRETIIFEDKSETTGKMKYGFNNYGYVGANILAQFGYENKSGFIMAATFSHGLGSINNIDYGARILHQVISLSFGKYIKR
ncbi:MAG: porin family protein [Chitinophagaceae bacterium]